MTFELKWRNSGMKENMELFRERDEGLRNSIEQEMDMEAPEYMEYADALERDDAAIFISEASIAEDGRYIPGQVCEVNQEAVEYSPELAELSEELKTWVKQGEPMSCAVASQTMTVNQLEGTFHSEKEMIDIGRQNEWYSDGTYPKDVGKIAEYMGFDVERNYNAGTEVLREANCENVKVLVSVDSTLLHYPTCEKECNPDHVVQVLRVGNTPQGEIVILNDPGHENGRGAVYPMSVFERAYDGFATTIRKGELA